MELTDVAGERFGNGYSCSQAVFSALAEPWNVSPDVSLRVAAGFGGGLARSAGTCGCVTGAVMAIGLAQPDVSPEMNGPEKEKTCQRARQFLREFEQRNGSTLCSELLGCNIGTDEGLAQARRDKLFKLRCPKLVRDAVEIVQGMSSGAGGPA